MRALVVIGVIAIIAAAPAPVLAQPAADAPALIKLIDNQPADMDRPTWKDKRRDAARKLVLTKDHRALPVLLKLAEEETFDIIGDIAIEGLGTFGDPSAVPTLQKIVADTSRDKGQRDLARKSLAKLGAGEAPVKQPETSAGAGDIGPTAGGGDSGGAAPPPTHVETSDVGGGSALLGTKSTSEIPQLPALDDDTLAAYERITFAGGTADFSYDTASKESDFDANVSGLYQKRIERPGFAWGVDAGAQVVTGLVNPPGRGQSRGAQIGAQADGEARVYAGGIYGVGKVAAAMQFDYVADIDANNPANDLKTTELAADGQVAVGGGYGRVLDIGAAIRVRRLSRALDAARALGKPIDAATSKKLQLTWWALRSERSAYRVLVATIAVLREAGILLGEPDGGLSYEILNVLRDTQLYQRPSGVDVQLTFSEGYLDRPGDLASAGLESGRVEQLIALAGYGTQLDEDKLEISGSGYARYRLFAPMGSPSPWAVGATATMRRFTYGEHGDPFGVFDLTGTIETSTDDLMASTNSLQISGQLGFTYVINQASGLRLAAQVTEDDGTLFLGAQLQATYGLLDGTFAR